MERQNGSGSGKHLRMNSGATNDDGNPVIQDRKFSISSSISSSITSSSSSFDPLELNSEEETLDDNVTKFEQDDLNLPSPEPVSSPNIASASLRTGPGALSSPEISPQNPESNSQNVSSMWSPPLQTMARPTNYDLNRIPTSVFSSKPSNPMEWSVASNESLFSIHAGNNSFSRDHAMLLGKSGELTKLDEINYLSIPPSVSESKSNELNNFSSSLPPVIETTADSDRKSTDMREDSRVKEVIDETLNIVSKDKVEDHNKEKMSYTDRPRFSETTSNISDGRGTPRISASAPRFSNESGNSSSSFAFPILAGDVGKNGPVKAVSEKQQPQPENPEATTKTDENKCFSCFPRFSYCPTCC